MPVELLQEIAKKPLPLTVEDTATIDKLRVLRAAGHVTVLLPAPSSQQAFAKVLAITTEGWTALQRLDGTATD